MDSAVTRKCGGLGNSQRTPRFLRILSAFTKLVDGRDVKGALFADVVLDGVKSCLKMLNCYISPQHEWPAPGTTREEQKTVMSPSHPYFFIYYRTLKDVVFIPPDVQHCIWIQMPSFPQALKALQVLRLGIQLTRSLITCRFLMVTFEEPAILN